MEAQTRHRLIGILLLLVLAAVVTPVLFRSPEQVRVALDLEIPPVPDIPALPLEPVVEAEEVETARESIDEAREEVVAAAARELEAEALPPPAARIPTGWSVQVASLSRRDSADALVKRLRDARYTAYVREAEQDGRMLYRVMVGPELERDASERLREQLLRDRRFKLDGLVIPYSL